LNGTVQLWRDGTVPGPYKKAAREDWLREVLRAQQSVRRDGPEEFHQIQLISLEELDEIRRIWLHEKHEFDDSLPRIYQEETGEPFPTPKEDGNTLQADDWNLLREVCDGDEVLFDLQVALLGVEQKIWGMTRRVGVIDALEKCLKAAIFEDEEEAFEVLSERDQRIQALKVRDGESQIVLFREDSPESR
jgi:DNA sulfur modification protein DndC